MGRMRVVGRSRWTLHYPLFEGRGVGLETMDVAMCFAQIGKLRGAESKGLEARGK